MIRKENSPCHGTNLRHLSGAVDSLYAGYLSPMGVSLGQFILLDAIKALERSSAAELAYYLSLDRTTVVRSVQPLIKAGWAAQETGTDKRRKEIYLTEQGKEKLSQCVACWRRAQADFESRLGPEKLKVFNDIIDIFGAR